MCSIHSKEDSKPDLPAAIRLPVNRGDQVQIWINGKAVQAYAGETVAAALLAEGIYQFRKTQKDNQSRGLFCGMGLCFDCLVTVDSTPNVQACLTPVMQGMRIETEGIQ